MVIKENLEMEGIPMTTARGMLARLPEMLSRKKTAPLPITKARKACVGGHPVGLV